MSFASAQHLGEVLQQSYGITANAVVPRPVGADANASVYRIDARRGQWWLKCRSYQVAPAVWDTLHWLRGTLGIEEIVAPWPALTGGASVQRWGLQFTLFPYVEGQSGFEAALSRTQWQRLGEVLRRLHEACPPPALQKALPSLRMETAALDTVGQWLAGEGLAAARDGLGRAFVSVWDQQHARIAALHAQALQLHAALQDVPVRLHLCHTDLHAGNLLMGNDGSLHLIDWDGLSLAPRERDLMFIGGAVGGRWGRENPLGFEEGYGSDRGDPRWIAWYRHWRILQDLIEFQQVLLGSDGEDRSPQLRRQSLHFLSEQFAPGNVFDAAERVYRAL
ncbi:MULTISPECIES: aminoglycoside phosphotransferase family protein [Stenotrophomonas]|uniref:Aminoglycoside phosphotransferase family protein n=2 Tax=Stenotrophomonas muris TaxID=2963283 RepID=A0ABU5ME98_9GAMM|nr:MULTISPECIES: aminoglycoside phosphotransferase family protein [Stenotrophomonas]MBH1367593.1 aminoglycoside phosphotransferase family protein [Stenotrophomonas maltophilia]MBH1434507.1 aminoglycoside phosphotransferase family protein [Stenotrophomonas maltophilia]MBH1490766.1 aminoglycoside phosphotransferase family protein [Stenotrophomonas maltophilia]MBH1548473.1 aminoglycoside phosphotransferase family protein [Stenotrophomonas maltophilia]MBH1571917.1 aminoglycoside phosphotransferase